MSRSRIGISVFLIGHLTAITIAALPDPDRLNKVGAARHPTDDRLAALVTPILDRFTAGFARIPVALSRITRPLHRPVGFYVGITGLGQYWAMFKEPPPYDRYFRVRYYVGSPSRPTWTARELVYPAHREDQVRV